MGGAVGVAVFGSLLANRLDHYLPRLVPAESLQGLERGELTGSPEMVAALPEAVHAGVVEAFASSIHVVFLVAAPIALLAFALTWLLREMPLRQDVRHHGRERPDAEDAPLTGAAEV